MNFLSTQSAYAKCCAEEKIHLTNLENEFWGGRLKDPNVNVRGIEKYVHRSSLYLVVLYLVKDQGLYLIK